MMQIILSFVMSLLSLGGTVHQFNTANTYVPWTDWEQATLYVPPTTFHSGDVFQSGWIDTQGDTAFTQIGWMEDPYDGPGAEVFFYSAPTSGQFVPIAGESGNAAVVSPGDSITVAVSCDFGTDIYQDWWRDHGVWDRVAVVNTGSLCGTTSYNLSLEGAYAQGAQPPSFSDPTPFRSVVIDSIGGVYHS